MSERKCAIFQRWLSCNLYLYRFISFVKNCTYIRYRSSLYATDSDATQNSAAISFDNYSRKVKRSLTITIDTLYKSIPSKLRVNTRDLKWNEVHLSVFNCLRSNSHFARCLVTTMQLFIIQWILSDDVTRFLAINLVAKYNKRNHGYSLFC